MKWLYGFAGMCFVEMWRAIESGDTVAAIFTAVLGCACNIWAERLAHRRRQKIHDALATLRELRGMLGQDGCAR